MKLRIKRSDFVAALAAVKPAAAVKDTLPVLANVEIAATNDKSVTLTCTNLDLTLRAKVDAVVEDKGAITVPAMLLLDIVRSIRGDEIFLDLNRKTLHVACGSSKLKLSGIEDDKFPSVLRVKDPVEFELPQFELYRLLATTAFAHGNDEKRPVINGAFVSLNGALNVVALDGYRIALNSFTGCKGKSNFILPAAAVTALMRLLDSAPPAVPAPPDEGQEPKPPKPPSVVAISAGPNGVAFTIENHTVVTKIIEGKYPDYAKIIPELKDDGIALPRTDLLDCVNRCAVVGNVCRLEFRKQNLVIVSENTEGDAPGEVVESLLCPSNVETTIKLSANYLREALSAIDADYVDFHLTGGPSVLTVPGEGPAGTWTTVITSIKEKKPETETKKAEPKK